MASLSTSILLSLACARPPVDGIVLCNILLDSCKFSGPMFAVKPNIYLWRLTGTNQFVLMFLNRSSGCL